MKSAHLEYFKSLLEGTAEISWNAWFSPHEEELKAELPRAAFLRLKFKKLEEAVVTFLKGNDLTDFAIERAEELLQRVDRESEK